MGHLLGASGAVEAVLTVLAVYERKAPVTINLENQDPEIPLDVVTSARDLPAGRHRGAEQLVRLRRTQRRHRRPQRLASAAPAPRRGMAAMFLVNIAAICLWR